MKKRRAIKDGIDKLEELNKEFENGELSYTDYINRIRPLFSGQKNPPAISISSDRILAILYRERLISPRDYEKEIDRRLEVTSLEILNDISRCRSIQLKIELKRIMALPVVNEEKVDKEIDEHLKICEWCQSFETEYVVDRAMNVAKVFVKERRHAVEEIGTKYKTAFPNVSFGIISSEETLCYTEDNFAQRLGYTTEELETPEALKKIIHPESKKALEESLETVLKKRQASRYPIKYIHKDGKTIVEAYIKAKPVDILDKNGECIGSFGLVIFDSEPKG